MKNTYSWIFYFDWLIRWGHAIKTWWKLGSWDFENVNHHTVGWVTCAKLGWKSMRVDIPFNTLQLRSLTTLWHHETTQKKHVCLFTCTICMKISNITVLSQILLSGWKTLLIHWQRAGAVEQIQRFKPISTFNSSFGRFFCILKMMNFMLSWVVVSNMLFLLIQPAQIVLA